MLIHINIYFLFILAIVWNFNLALICTNLILLSSRLDISRFFKGHLNLISSDPSCKDVNALFKMETLETFIWSNKIKEDIVVFETVTEYNEFEPRLKSAKNRFQLSRRLNLETLNTILSEINRIWAAAYIFKPRLKFFKFGLCLNCDNSFIFSCNVATSFVVKPKLKKQVSKF